MIIPDGKTSARDIAGFNAALRTFLNSFHNPHILRKLHTLAQLRLHSIVMPKSKRAKVVHLSKTTKKGKELTLRLYANIRESIPKYPYIYVFSVDNMRNTYLKDVRNQLSDSRYIFIPFYLFYMTFS